MKRLFTFALVALFAALGATTVGCEAKARVGDPDNTTETTYERRTTVEQPRDGVRTEVEVERRR